MYFYLSTNLQQYIKHILKMVQILQQFIAFRSQHWPALEVARIPVFLAHIRPELLDLPVCHRVICIGLFLFYDNAWPSNARRQKRANKSNIYK